MSDCIIVDDSDMLVTVSMWDDHLYWVQTIICQDVTLGICTSCSWKFCTWFIGMDWWSVFTNRVCHWILGLLLTRGWFLTPSYVCFSPILEAKTAQQNHHRCTGYKRKLSIWSTTEYATANNRIFYKKCTYFVVTINNRMLTQPTTECLIVGCDNKIGMF